MTRTRGWIWRALVLSMLGAAASLLVGAELAIATESVAPTQAAPLETRLTIDAPSECSAKASVIVTATLTDASGTPLPGRAVFIERLGDGIVVLGASATDGSGHVVTELRPTSRMSIRARFEGDQDFAACESTVVAVSPRVLLTRPWTHDAFAYPGQPIPARGSLWPRHSSGSVATTLVCERLEHGKWVVRARYRASIATTARRSTYAGVVRLPKSGLWRIRATHGDPQHAKTLGPAQKVRVSDWPNRYRGLKIGGFRTSRKMVAITIDDGPNAHTGDICRILERYDGRGTFFFTRRLLDRGYGPQARRVYERGHEIANHTATHKMLTGSYSTSYRQAIGAKRAIKGYTGFAPVWIRAMGGGIDATGMRAVVDTGQLYCNWSIDSYDSHKQYTAPGTLYSNVMRGVRPGSVILMHQTHPESIVALPRICRELRRRGYSIVTLSELAARSRPR